MDDDIFSNNNSPPVLNLCVAEWVKSSNQRHPDCINALTRSQSMLNLCSVVLCVDPTDLSSKRAGIEPGCGRLCECAEVKPWVVYSHDRVDPRQLLEHLQSTTHQECSPCRRVGQHPPDHWAIWTHTHTGRIRLLY